MVQVNFPTAEFTGTKLLPAREVGYQHPDNSLTRLVYHPSTITYAIKPLQSTNQILRLPRSIVVGFVRVRVNRMRVWNATRNKQVGRTRLTGHCEARGAIITRVGIGKVANKLWSSVPLASLRYWDGGGLRI